MFVLGLIYNLSLLVALSVLSDFVYTKFQTDTSKSKIAQGLIFGITAVIGMNVPFVLHEGLFFDGRSVIITVCGLFFGPVPAIIAGLPALLYRIYIGGPGVYMGSSVVIESIIIGIIFYHFRSKLFKKSPLWTFYLMGLISSIVMLATVVLLPGEFRSIIISSMSLEILLVYPFATLLTSKILYNQENRYQLLDELSMSNQLFKDYIKYSSDAVFIIDKDMGIVSYNPEAYKLSNSIDENQSKGNFGNFASIEDSKKDKECFNRAVHNGYSSCEVQFIQNNNEIIWHSIEYIKINDNKYLKLVKDINDRKKSEALVKDTLARFRSIFDLAPNPMLIVNSENMTLVNANKAFLDLFGYNKDSIVDKKLSDLNCRFWANVSTKREFFRLVKENNIVRNYYAEINHFDKSIFKCFTSGTLMQSEDRLYYVVAINDQTQRIIAEEESARNVQKYKSLIEQLSDGFYQSTSEGRFIYVNPAFVKMLGYSSEKELLTIDIVNELYFKPEDREVEKAKKYSYDSNYEIYRLKRKDGTPIWIEEHSRYLEDDLGQIVIREGICRDISYRIKIEEEREELFTRLKNVSEQLPGFICQFNIHSDGTMSFPFISEGVFDIYGITSEEAVNNPSNFFTELVHEDDMARIKDSFTESFNNLTLWNEEYRIVQKDSSIMWIEGRAKPVKLSDGTITWYGYNTNITKRKKQEEKIRYSERSLQASQEIASIGSWEYSIKSKKMSWSRNFYRILEYEPDSVKPSVNNFLQKVHSLDKEMVSNLLFNLEKETERTSFECRLLLSDSKIKWLVCINTPIYEDDKIIILQGIIHDITLRKAYENNLHKLTRAIEQNPLGVLIVDLVGHVEYANKKYCEMSGYGLEELKRNKTFQMSDYENGQKMFLDIYESLQESYSWHGVVLTTRKNGEKYWTDVQLSTIFDDNGMRTHYVVVAEDVTKKIEFRNELIQAKQKAEESDRLKSAFLSNMSHEIRTPMNGIVGFARILANEVLDEEEKQEYLQLMNSSCDRLINTVNDVLDLSKIESKQMSLDKKSFRLDYLLSELYENHLMNFTLKGLLLILDDDSNITNEWVIGDEHRIYQVLNNFLTNACKFTENGNVNFGIEILDSDTVKFYVSDTGLGISEDNLKFIFGRFNQIDSSLSRRYEGSGLGLPICNGLAELMNGRIAVESRLGEGSTFELIIPLERVAIKI